MPDNNNNFISAIRGYLRLGSFPLDASTVFGSYDEAKAYAEYNPTAYAGQIVSVVDDRETERTVIVYKLNFSDEPGKNFELGALIGADGTNGQIDGNNVFHTYAPNQIEAISAIINFLTGILSYTTGDTVEGHVISKLKVDTNQISESNDVITRGYLDSAINFNTIGVVKTVQVLLDTTGGQSEVALPGNSRIKKITVDIENGYGPLTGISIYLGSYTGDTGVFTIDPDPIVAPGDIIQHPGGSITHIDLNEHIGIAMKFIKVVIQPGVEGVPSNARGEVLVDYLASPFEDVIPNAPDVD
jgi:hypothetical protein